MNESNNSNIPGKMSQRLENWLLKGHFFNAHDCNIFYRLEGAGPYLLVVHGYPYSGYDFSKILPDLSANFRVLIPDMPGMGFSDKPVNYPFSFANYANMYTALLHHLGIDEVHVLALDLGNSVVQELLARSEEGDRSVSIKSIAYLNGGLFSDVYRPRLIQVLLSKSPAPVGKFLSHIISRRSIEKATRSVFGKHTQPSEELLNDFWDILSYKKGKNLAWKIGRLIFEKDTHQTRWISAMQQTTIPMCFINGPADPNSGIHMANRYKELIPDGNVKLLSGDIGHWPHLEATEEVLTAFYAFHKECR